MWKEYFVYIDNVLSPQINNNLVPKIFISFCINKFTFAEVPTRNRKTSFYLSTRIVRTTKFGKVSICCPFQLPTACFERPAIVSLCDHSCPLPSVYVHYEVEGFCPFIFVFVTNSFLILIIISCL